MDFEEHLPSRRPVKSTLESKHHIPARLQVRVPKDLFESALNSGNKALVARGGLNTPLHGSAPVKAGPPSVQLTAAAAALGAYDMPLAPTGATSLLRTRVLPKPQSPRKTTAAAAAAAVHTLRSHTAGALFFDPAVSDVFPPRCPELHSVDDFVDADGDSPPPDVHPLGWVPTEDPAPGRDLLPLRPRTGQLPVKSSTSMALECFDSPEMELMRPEERMATKRDPAVPGLLGYSRFFTNQGTFTWAPCYVLQYDRAQDMYQLQWLQSGKLKWARRLNLFFAEESRIGFRFRLRQARRRRDECEREARYHQYVSRQPFHHIDTLDDARKRRILKRSGVSPTLPPSSAVAERANAHFEDFRGAYRYAVNAAIVDQLFGTEEGAAHLAAANVQDTKLRTPVPQQACVNLTSLPLGRVVATLGAEVERLDVGLEPFALLGADVRRISFLASTQLLEALHAYHREVDVSTLLLVDVQLAELQLPARPADFARLQKNALDSIGDNLMDDWTIKVVAVVENIVQASNITIDGGADVATSAEFNQIMRFVKMLSLKMSDQLRSSALSSIAAYQQFWERYSLVPGSREALAGYPDRERPQTAPPTGDLSHEGTTPPPAAAAPRTGRQQQQQQQQQQQGAAAVAHADGARRPSHGGVVDNKWGADLFSPSPPPLFLLDLQVSHGSLVLEPSLEEVVAGVIRSFDRVITATQRVDDISVKIVNMASQTFLPTVQLNEPAALSARSAILAVLTACLAAPAALLASFGEFAGLVTLDVGDFMAGWRGRATVELEQTVAELERLDQLAVQVESKAECRVVFRLLAVDTRAASCWLADKARQLRALVLEWTVSEWVRVNQEAVNRIDAIVATMNETPDTTEAMDALETYVAWADGRLVDIAREISDSRQVCDALHAARAVLEPEAVELFWRLGHSPVTLKEELEEVRRRLSRFRGRYMTQLKSDQLALAASLAELKAEVEAFVRLGDLKQVDDRLASVLDMEGRLRACRGCVELYQSREAIFLLPPTDHPVCDVIDKMLEPYASLWRTASELGRSLPEWMDGPFPEIDAEQMASEVDRWWRGAAKLAKTLNGPCLEVVKQVRLKLEEFQTHIPLVIALRNPGLRDRHWDKLSATMGFPVKADAGFSLTRALQLGLPAQLPALEEVSEYASKEHSLERTLDKMQGDWTGARLESVGWRSTGTTILRALDDLQMMLDDQIIKTQAMRASPYIAPFEDRVRLWEVKLNMTQEVLDAWLTCQAGWLYLEPIFGSEDIMAQMPNEGRKFKAVDTTWRRTMEKLDKNPEVLAMCSDEELLKGLLEANKLLESVNKGLADYLETKRLAFPRFYFLSNDELLEILSETKDPTRVQPFLRKIFEGINSLVFGPNGEVTAMCSEEGEKVPFISTFNPKDSLGNVERWLIECEIAMRDTMKATIHSSFDAYTTTQRIKWVTDWPGQVVIAVDCMYWTKEAVDAIQKSALPEYATQCTEELMKVVNKVRGPLSRLDRKTLSALIVIDVHARDVITELAALGVSTEADFEWSSQMRYSWEGGEVSVRMINAHIYYGYEYLGNGSRLVITPLTDRCYRTLMGALHLNLGGAPEGPAGTGKTETTKDLAKAIAMQCVVFNCSDGLDYLAMGKFFKGLVSSGAWACFDEFNRIDLEVLSVVAQQILTMQRAKASGAKSFDFEGSRISIRPTFSVFITMNPGYAGRSELPDNLKALFRSVAMMVPDYALISEIMLYSSGYLQARDLARKLVATYRLCSEQLSSQSHYDYGMRAVMSVLRAAAANKQKFPDQVEDILMLRSIKDVNEPKFLAPDVPLFGGILSDLFPGIDLPPSDYTSLDAALLGNCGRMNLQPTPAFIEKAHQLYEMVLVRHGLMVVGYSYAAKTSVWRVLAAALGDLEEQGLMEEHRVQVKVMNPKSIYLGQLYGMFDPVSHEWKDGCLAKIFRACSVDPSPDRKWVLFDGPVDAVWIENMNTVLDDNKKLCLNSGEIIQMSNSMSMIFEVQDLAVASPATVSRCGMVYMEPQSIGWRPLRDSWMVSLPASLTDEHRARLRSLFEWLVDPCLAFVRKNCRELVPTSDIALPVSLMSTLHALMDEMRDGNSEMAVKDYPKILECLFVFSLVWSLGASTEGEGRAKFSTFLRKLLEQQVDRKIDRTDFDLGPGLEILDPGFKLSLNIPKEGSVYDYVFDKVKANWKPWMETVNVGDVPESALFNEIIITTIDTVRYSFLLQLLVTHGRHIMFTGPTGTGKTVYVKAALEALDKAVYGSIQTAFSAQTNANMVQDIIDAKLDKRRKGVYGPPFGMRTVIFVDDLNMPALETYGAQPPVELLRQWMDHGGHPVCDRDGPTWRGGGTLSRPRFVRHFNLVCIAEFDDDTYQTIYGSITDWWMRRARCPEEVQRKGAALVRATIQMYNTIRKELLPTPAKSHYTYNMRDMSKVFQGIQAVGVAVDEPGKLVRLWAHELLRVFHDRLVSDEDKAWFCGTLKDSIDTHMGLRFEDVYEPRPGSDVKRGDVSLLRTVLFCDFQGGSGPENQKYEEVADLSKLLATVEGCLAEYNAQVKNRMDLVLFVYAVEHICRISRIMKQPYGNGLLVGVGGSGRQSLTRIATFMADYRLFSIEITKSYTSTEWREDLKRVLRQAGASAIPTVFLFSDTQLKEESFLEDINNILNTGEVPNLFPKDEMVVIMEAVTARAKKAGKPLTPASLYAFFIEQARANLHMILCMSPVGSAFRERLRKFPSLVNCTTIDWFSVWPADALKAVASRFLHDVEFEEGGTRSAVEDMCMTFHVSVRALAVDYQREVQRFYYTTPTSFLELIQTYKELLGGKRKAVLQMKGRYEVGLEKLLAAEKEVNTMKVELIQLQPKLIETGKEVVETLKVVDAETREAEAKKVVVLGEEAVANEKAASSKAIKDECEGDLAVAMPLLESALAALNTLTKGDITEVKSMKSPPAVVKLVMEAVCTMMLIKPKKVNDPANPSKKMDDYWTPSQALLGEPGFLSRLQEFDKDNIAPAIVTAIRPYVAMPEFEPEVVKKASKAAYGLCCWVRAMEAYDRVAKVVAPKKAKLAEAEAEFTELMVGLNAKKAELAGVERRLAALNSKLGEMQARKAQLEFDVDLCEKKLDRATKLIGGLGGEKTRWTEVAAKLGHDIINLTGDVLLSSGAIAYLGAFTALYRDRATRQWVGACKASRIPCSDVFRLVTVLGEPVRIRDWTIDGLPNDSFSIDNGIIVSKARRWPLLIDPQGQANKWIKAMEKKSQLEVLKLSDGDYMRKLENCIQFGFPVLLENVGEELDPTLEPVLLKSVFKQGGRLCIRMGDSTIEYSDSFRSNDIATKQLVADKTERKIDEARMGYKPVARHASVLFFNISELATIEPMYQYSLGWFVSLFEETILKAEKSREVARRIEGLVRHFTYSLYVNICRSLFEKDKLLFSFTLAVSIRAHITKELDLAQFRFLLTGGVSTAEPPANPSEWLSEKLWGEMVRLGETFKPFAGLSDSFAADQAPWRAIYDSADPTKVPFPAPWPTKLTTFQRLLLLRLIRPDKLVVGVQQYVLEDSTSLTPLIFVLSPGADPMSALLKYADTMHVRVESISLGQGQGPKAAALIELAQANGGWVVLQNCHLAVSWMPSLERIAEGLSPDTTSPAFRLWLTSYPSPHFPVSVLQSGIKMTNDPPKGCVQTSQAPTSFKKLLFGLCFFHAFVQERLKFGPLGWNVPYQFSQPDFVISVRQLQMFLNESTGALPMKALSYLTGECNYGGRVTDAHDRRTLMSILNVFYTDAITDDSYSFSPSGLYKAPHEGEYDSYLAAIKALPIAAEPEVFGLHANADITKDRQEADMLLASCLATQGNATASGGQSREAVLADVAADIRARVALPFDIEAARFKYPVDYYESMNTVLCQELVRFNGLIEVVHSSLVALQKALKGQVLMSDDLEALGTSMFDGKAPRMWMEKSYPSMKPLGGYVNDLIERINMMAAWIEHGPPATFWITGFYFTHAFLTGVKQNYARKYKIAIDTVIFSYTCLPPGTHGLPAVDGAYVDGMFVEGARWDSATMLLQESLPKVLFSCPLYRTPERRGVLATTGHSTNFVMELMVPSPLPQEHWVRRGVAFLLSLAE
ncbi:MAG: hypothetical protein WDW38_008798 [Sanguina aurantia]